MVGTANVYVSVTRALDEKNANGYRKPQHSWMLSVEPHHTHIPGTQHKDVEPIHYAAFRDEETGIYSIRQHSSDNEPAIIGNILIAESVHTSPEQVHVILELVFNPSDPSKAGAHDGDDLEHWIRTAVHAIQEHKIAHPFNVDEFMTFAHGYEASRMENEAPALVAYPKIHKDYEKKANKHKFWITHPMSSRTKTNHKGEAMTYGGLM